MRPKIARPVETALKIGEGQRPSEAQNLCRADDSLSRPPPLLLPPALIPTVLRPSPSPRWSLLPPPPACGLADPLCHRRPSIHRADSERRANLHIRFIRSNPMITTKCCKALHCFR